MISDTKLTFSYQYFIIYNVWYERPICARIPDISPNIRYSIWKTLIRYDPDIRYLEPWVDDIYNTKPTFSYQYFIIYSVRYERPICARIPDISSDIWYEKSLSDKILISDI